MIILIDILVSIVLIAVGYISLCNYFNSEEKSYLKVSKNRILYLTAALGVSLIMTIVLNAQYEVEYLGQIKLLSLVLLMFPSAAVDYRIQKIPNKFLIRMLLVRCVLYVAELIVSPSNFVNVLIDGVIGALVFGGFFLLLLVIFKNSIGMGDIKLFFVMGLYQGLWGTLNSVFFSLVASFFFSIILLVMHKKKRTDTISFGPSILLGTIIAICMAGM